MADEFVPTTNADTGVGMPTAQDNDLLTQMLLARNALPPEAIAALAQQRSQYMDDVRANTGNIIEAATTSNQQYQAVNSNARNALMSNAEQQAIIAAKQLELSKQAAEASAVITDNVNAARNNTLLQVGGIHALDSMGFKIQQAMALNEQKQLAAQQAVKSSNPVVEGLLSAFGIKSQAQAAVEEADIAQENYARTVRQRNDLVTAMSGADSLVTQLGTALNGATQKAALDKIAVEANIAGTKLQAQALSNDAQSITQLSNMESNAIQHNFSTLNTIYQVQRQQLAAEFSMMSQGIREAGSTKYKEAEYIKNIGATIGKVSPELQAQYFEAAQSKNKEAMQAIQDETDTLLQAGALLGLTPQNKAEWAANSTIIKRIADGKKAGKKDSEIIMELNNPMFTSRFMTNNPQLYSGSAAIYNPDSVSAMQNLIGSFVAHTTNGGKGKPLAPQEVAQVNTEVLKTLEKEAANPFSSRNKVIRMDVASLIAAAQTSPDSPFAKSPVTQFLLNRYKENPKAVITLEDYKAYLINSSQLGAFGTRFNQQAFNDVIRHINTMYADVVNRSGVRVYGADYNIVPEVASLYAINPGVTGMFNKAVRLPVTSPDALSRILKNASGLFSANVDERHEATDTPIQNLFYTEEGDK
jgi:phage terminase small subunit